MRRTARCGACHRGTTTGRRTWRPTRRGCCAATSSPASAGCCAPTCGTSSDPAGDAHRCPSASNASLSLPTHSLQLKGIRGKYLIARLRGRIVRCAPDGVHVDKVKSIVAMGLSSRSEVNTKRSIALQAEHVSMHATGRQRTGTITCASRRSGRAGSASGRRCAGRTTSAPWGRPRGSTSTCTCARSGSTTSLCPGLRRCEANNETSLSIGMIHAVIRTSICAAGQLPCAVPHLLGHGASRLAEAWQSRVEHLFAQH